MANGMTRRETLRRGLVVAGALELVPEWSLPAPWDKARSRSQGDDCLTR